MKLLLLLFLVLPLTGCAANKKDSPLVKNYNYGVTADLINKPPPSQNERVIAEINGEPITQFNLRVWMRLINEMKKNRPLNYHSEVFDNQDEQSMTLSKVIDIYLMAEESLKYFTALENHQRNLSEKIAYYTSPAFLLKSIARKKIERQDRFLNDEERAERRREREKQLLAELLTESGLLNFPSYEINEVKIDKLLRENSASLDITPAGLREYLLKMAYAGKIREFWADDVKKTAYVPPREILEYYTANSLEFQNFKHLLLKKECFEAYPEEARKLAQNIILALEQGRKFEDFGLIVQEYNCAAIMGSLLPELQALVLNLREREAGFVQSELGFHIVQFLPKEKFKDAQEKILKKLQEQKIQAKVNKLIEDLRKKAVILYIDPRFKENAKARR